MLHKKLAIAAVAGATAMLPTMGSAQVVPSIGALIVDTNEDISTLISSIAGNDNTVDGSILIDIAGSAGGELAGDFSESTTNLVDVDGVLSLEGSAVGGSALGALTGTGAGAGNLDVSYLTDNSTLTTGAFAGSIGSTSVDVGDVAATALGAVNNGTVDLTETAGTIVTNASAGTSGTNSAADYALNAGSGLAIEQIAANTAEITGTATINFVGNGSVGSIGTTAAGAINSSEITANVTGAVFGAPVN